MIDQISLRQKLHLLDWVTTALPSSSMGMVISLEADTPSCQPLGQMAQQDFEEKKQAF